MKAGLNYQRYLDSSIHAPSNYGLNSNGILYPGYSSHLNHRVNSGEAVWLVVASKDLLKINCQGKMRFAIISRDDGSNALKSIISSPLQKSPVQYADFDSREIQAKLKALALPLDKVHFYEFDCQHDEEEMLVWQATKDVYIIIALPASAESLVTGELARSFISVTLQENNSHHQRLPTPLGKVMDEFTIAKATAKSYEIPAGAYVQIIDVEGRQCSDFMAFNSAALDKGLEKHIDSTVSRSFTAGAYPRPGLHDKFFDSDITPLLAMTQDTIGRHDTFALACTARGYEERGFPGHVNCSDNISNAIDKYGIKKRVAWPAINFFFNSWIHPSDNLLNSDEAWSRPGDYVLMKALTNLVAVSTACPDDIDPINGWNPTDIHVRIYHPENKIPISVAYRISPNDKALMTNPSPFHNKTSQLTNQYQAHLDYWMPQYFDATGSIQEYWACRECATIQDMSNFRIIDIAGVDAQNFLQQVMTRDIAKLSLNKGVYSLIVDESGTVLDDGTLFHIGPSLYRWICSSNESFLYLESIAKKGEQQVWFRNMSKTLCTLSVQGRKSKEIMNKLLFLQPTQPIFANLPWFGSCVARLHDRVGVPMMVSRSGYTGELGYELFVDQRHAEEVWDAVITAGGDDITPMGSDALGILRIESGLMAMGNEFGHMQDAFEAGLGFAVDLNKNDFIGKDALVRSKENQRKKLVGLLFAGNEVPQHGDLVFHERIQVGVVTSAVFSPMLEKAIAMALINVEYADVATQSQLSVGKGDGFAKRLTASLAQIPFIDPKRQRPRDIY